MHQPHARHVRRAAFGCAIFVALGLVGCAAWRPVTVPIPTIRIPSACTTKPDTLVVMLPGAASRPEEFETEGLVDAMRTRGIAADVVLVDAHLGYYRNRSVVDRLRADVVAPALAQGYRQVWLVGISLGGVGALLYAAQQPQGIAGIVAIAPYLGEPATLEAIRAQGGLQTWRAPPDPLEPDDIGSVLWRWLQPYALAPAPVDRPPLYLGYGLADRLRPGHDLLAAALPAGHVFTAPGDHDYPAWRAVWAQALDAAPLPRDPGCKRAG
jgi:pimeloyl-ACP methyl ester carboxylesterase